MNRKPIDVLNEAGTLHPDGEQTRGDVHTCTLLAMGPPPISSSPTGRRFPQTDAYRAWEQEVYNWMLARDGLPPNRDSAFTRHKHELDDFIVWLGLKEMENLMATYT